MIKINSRLNKENLRRFWAILMVAILSITFIPESIAKADVEDIALYEDRSFYGQSAPEIVELDVDCACISFYATCEGNTVDYLIAYVINLDTGLGNTFYFDADGSVETSMTEFEAGEYRVYFIGSSSIKKLNAIMVFTEIDPWIAN